MKLFRSVDLNRNLCPADLYEAARRLASKPDDRGSINLHVEAEAGDEDSARLVERILALCQERGLDKVRGAYSWLVVPIYEPADLAAAPFLRFWTQRKSFKAACCNRRDEHGRVVLPATEAKATVKIASVFPQPWIVVSSATRRVLESGGLAGLRFDEVAIRGHSIHAAPEPFWELRSEVTLPKMTNSMIHSQDEWPSAPYTIDDPYVEPHYRKSELHGLGNFDIAHLFERDWNGSQGLVISQAFYRHCLKNRMPLEVRPVRIEP